MKCSKCNGFMFVERYYDHFLRFDAWKCINCGSITDSTIVENKNRELYEVKKGVMRLSAPPVLAKAE